MFRIKMVAWENPGGLNTLNNLFNNSFNKEAPKYIPIREQSGLGHYYDKSNFNNSAYKEIKVNERSDSFSRSNYSKPSSSKLSNPENKFNYFFNNLNISEEYKHSNKSTSPSKNNNVELNDFKYHLSPNKNYAMERSLKVENNTKLQNSSNEKSYVNVKDSYDYNNTSTPSNLLFSFLRPDGRVQKMKYIKVEDAASLFSELFKKREEKKGSFLKRPSEIFNNKDSNKSIDRFPPLFKSRFYS